MKIDCFSEDEAKKWYHILTNCIYGANPTDPLVPKKKLLVLLNPFGGAGRAVQVYEKASKLF